MKLFEIRLSTSYENLDVLKLIYQPSWRIKEVTIDYNCSKGLPDYDSLSDNWPFKAIFEDENGETGEIRIFSLTAGYSGTGPHDLASILDFLKIDYNQNDIFTKSKQSPDGYIHLKYTAN